MKISNIIIILFLTSTVTALGVGPVQVYKEFNPAGQDTVTVKIFNNENQDMLLKIYVRGDMKEYISIPKSHEISVGTSISEFTYNIHYPDELPPGAHFADIVIEEVPSGDGMIQTVESHITKLRVQVPYNEPYAEAKITTEADEKSAMIKIYVQSFTLQNINAFASVDFMLDGAQLKNIVTEHELIQPMNEERFDIKTELPEGIYTAVANVFYSERTIRLVDEFIVGRYLLEITNVTIDPFVPGEVAAINTHMKNIWPQTIRAHGKIEFYQKGKLEDTVETFTFEIEDEKTITTFWDTKGKSGNYTAIVTMFYGDNKATGDLLVSLEPKKVRMWWIMPVILLGVIVFVLYRKFYSKSI